MARISAGLHSSVGRWKSHLNWECRTSSLETFALRLGLTFLALWQPWMVFASQTQQENSCQQTLQSSTREVLINELMTFFLSQTESTKGLDVNLLQKKHMELCRHYERSFVDDLWNEVQERVREHWLASSTTVVSSEHSDRRSNGVVVNPVPLIYLSPKSPQDIRTSFVSVQTSLKGQSYVVAGSENAQVRHVGNLWMVTEMAPQKIFNAIDWQSHQGWISDAAISPKEDLFATAGVDGKIKLWRVSNGSLLRTIKSHSQMVNSVEFSPDGEELLSTSASSMHLTGAKQSRTLLGHSDWVKRAVFSQDGQWIISGSQDRTALIWRRRDGKVIHKLEGHEGPVESVVFSRDAEFALTGSTRSVRLWRVADGKLLGTFDGHIGPVHSLGFIQGDRTIVSASIDGTIRFWNRGSMKPVYNFQPFENDTVLFQSMAMTGDERHILTVASFRTGAGETLRVWNLDLSPLELMEQEEP